MRTCSACAGDYEDPDRTAWPSAEEQLAWDDNAPDCTSDSEFPEELSAETD